MTADHPSILIIDDDPDILATIRAMLEPAGFDVETAANLRDAIAKINIVAPTVIVTDIYMPGGDGYELIQALRRYRLRVPVIAISGGPANLDHHGHLEIAQGLGAVETMAKPFRAPELIEAINRAIAQGAGE